MSTLIEKLEREYQKWCEHEDKSEFGSGEAIDARGRTRGLLSAIQVVKQHSDWISVNERLPDEEQEVIAVLELTGFYMLAFLRNGIWCNADDGEQIARHKDRQAVTYWMPIPSPPKPPSEVQP